MTTIAAMPRVSPAPDGFTFGEPPVAYDLSTTATFTSAVVCFDFSGRVFDESVPIRLLHYEGGQWVDVTTSLNLETHTVCGTVTSFSPFVVAQPVGVAGTMRGRGEIVAGGGRYRFDFDARPPLHDRDKGRLELKVSHWNRRGRRLEFESTPVDTAFFWDGVAAGPRRGRADAGADSLLLRGYGKWNGVAGYSFEAFAQDRGAPGHAQDQFSITVKDAQGVVVATVGGRVDRGDIEAGGAKPKSKR